MNRSRMILLTLFTLICGGYGNAQTPQPPTISVTGRAEVKVAPDEAIFHLEIEGQDKDLQKAKALNDATLQKLLAALKPLIPDQRLIQTGYVSLEREHEIDSGKDEPKIVDEYKLSREVSIVLRDLSRFETLLAEIVRAGVTQISNIELRSSKLREYKDKARAMAMKAAQEKATLMAAEIGQAIGKAISVTEQGAGFSFASQGLRNATTTIQGNLSDSESLFVPGLISVKANVAIIFELR
jgi:uncharacterized protein YggE